MFRAQTSETNSESRTDFELYNYILGGGHTNDENKILPPKHFRKNNSTQTKKNVVES